jgi:hypothetical protein
MQRACTLAAVIWIGLVHSAAAQTTLQPGMGTTSPLGTTLSEPAPAMGNIPLGATELNQAGISPLMTPCPSTDANTSFDGGGISTSTACSSASTGNAIGTASTAADINSTAVGSASPSGIGLGATDLGTPGESQTVPVPGVSVAPCNSMPATSDPANSIGMMSSGSC